MTILREGRLEEPSPYGEAPYVTTRGFWESGEALRLLHSDVAIDCPVRLLHGQADTDVPWTWSLELLKRLRSPDVQTVIVKAGDNRLPRESDIALLIGTVPHLLEARCIPFFWRLPPSRPNLGHSLQPSPPHNRDRKRGWK